MKMYPHTRRLLNRILELLGKYQSQEISLQYLVDEMYWTVNAFSENLDEFIEEWKVYWGDLEEILSIGAEHRRQKEISTTITALVSIVNKYLSAE